MKRFSSLAPLAGVLVLSLGSGPALGDGPLVSYERRFAEVADDDPATLLRVHSDGQVFVHLPGYMKRGGDYEATLDPADLEELLRTLAGLGRPELEPELLRSQREAAVTEAAREGRFHVVADADTSIIEIRIGESTRRFSWVGLEWDAKHYPQVDGIRALARAEEDLARLIERVTGGAP